MQRSVLLAQVRVVEDADPYDGKCGGIRAAEGVGPYNGCEADSPGMVRKINACSAGDS